MVILWLVTLVFPEFQGCEKKHFVHSLLRLEAWMILSDGFKPPTTDHFGWFQKPSFFPQLCATYSFFVVRRHKKTTLNSCLSCVLSTSYSYMRPNHPYLYVCIYIMFLMFVSHTLPCWFAYRLLGFVSVVLFGWRGLARIACPMDETIPGPKVDKDIGCLA